MNNDIEREEIDRLQAENEALRARVAELHLALRIADKQVRLRQQHAPVCTVDVQESLRFTKAALSDHVALAAHRKEDQS